MRANEQGGGFAGGIYVDGGRDIVIEQQRRRRVPISGIEIGAENAGIVDQNIVVRDNVLHEQRQGAARLRRLPGVASDG